MIVLASEIAPPYPPFDGAPVEGQDHTIENSPRHRGRQRGVKAAIQAVAVVDHFDKAT